jgi:hypothetical protein
MTDSSILRFAELQLSELKIIDNHLVAHGTAHPAVISVSNIIRLYEFLKNKRQPIS